MRGVSPTEDWSVFSILPGTEMVTSLQTRRGDVNSSQTADVLRLSFFTELGLRKTASG